MHLEEKEHILRKETHTDTHKDVKMYVYCVLSKRLTLVWKVEDATDQSDKALHAAVSRQGAELVENKTPRVPSREEMLF